MIVEFRLTIKKAVIAGKFVDFLELNWQEELTAVQLAGRFNKWLYDDEFVEKKLPDLHRAKVCLLSINPLQASRKTL